MTAYSSDTTIDHNQIENGRKPTVEYAANGIKITIDPNINVLAQDNLNTTAVFSTRLSSALVNNGNVAANSGSGVVFLGNDSSIVNKADGSISGFFGVALDGDGAELTNHGAIRGLEDVGSTGVSLQGANNVLNNDGEIWGAVNGVQMFSNNHDGGVINNSGSIEGDVTGIKINTKPGLTTVIHNDGGGLIQGAPPRDDGFVTAAIDVDDGRLRLDNRGKIKGDINSLGAEGDQKDVVINRGKIKDGVYLGSGNDKYKGKGHGTADAVFAYDGNDKLMGSKADDYLDGGADDDLLRGGKGKDKMLGDGGEEAGSDTFDFNSIKDSVVGSKRDKILDFQRGDDEIDLKDIDAKKGSGNQKFEWIGKHDFHDKKGELRIEDKGKKVIVQGDVKGDGHADFEIFVKVGNLHDDDFVL